MTDQQKLEIIRDQVFDYLEVNPADTRRKREVVEARQFTMYYGKLYTELTLARIAAIFNKDHATTSHALKVVPALLRYKEYQVKDGRMRFYITKELFNEDLQWCNKVAQI